MSVNTAGNTPLNVLVRARGGSIGDPNDVTVTQLLTAGGVVAVAATPVNNSLLGYSSTGVIQAITLTTTGTSGASTVVNGVLNIPQYSGGGGGGTSTGGFRWGLGIGIPIATGTNVTGTYFSTQSNGNWSRWDITAGVQPSGNSGSPTGNSVIVDILASVDHGGNWASLWPTNTSNRPTLAINGVQNSNTAFDTAAYVAGTLLRVDIIQVGGTYAGSQIILELS